MSNDRAKKALGFYLTRVGRIVLACILVVVAIWPMSMQPQATQAAPAYAPQTPTPPTPPSPTPTPPPLSGEGAAAQAPQTPPSPNNLPPEVKQARARQAIEAALAKYLRYWGPRYQVAPIEVAVEGEWAHGVAQWQGETQTLSGPIHILACRPPDGDWQALLPGSDQLYRQWVDAIPESLVPVGEKGQLRTQAAEADALWLPQATPIVPPLVTISNEEKSGEMVGPMGAPVQSTTTPTAALPTTGISPTGGFPGEPIGPIQTLVKPVPTSTSSQVSAPYEASIYVERNVTDLQGFHLVSVDEGWLFLDQHLYWTKTGGQSWNDITPPNLGQSILRAVSFWDTQYGWLVLSSSDESSSITYALARTLDGGNTWQTTPLSLSLAT